jgi:tyrosyl-tRNA synthetase
MAKKKSLESLLDELTWRGLVENQTPGFKERLAEGPITGYVGFDPTASSLQIGNLVPVMLLAHLQRAGGKPLVVIGGGTGLIGDPSGRRSERPLHDEDTVRENAARQRAQLERFLDFSAGPSGAEVVDNAEWLTSLGLVSFLRDVGKHFTLSYMLQKESVKSRLEEGISYTEFSYMLLQAYDFLQLYREHGCELQLGGSDQWGNITAGRELVRKVAESEVHGLTAPLLTTSTGGKFGKTEEGGVWLDAAMTSPYRFYQFWVNVDDRDVLPYLRSLTFISRDEIGDLMERHSGRPEQRIPHKALAGDVTTRVHGERAAEGAQSASRGEGSRSTASRSRPTRPSGPIRCWREATSGCGAARRPTTSSESRADQLGHAVEFLTARGLRVAFGESQPEGVVLEARQHVQVKVEHLLPRGAPVRRPHVEARSAHRVHYGRPQTGADLEQTAGQLAGTRLQVVEVLTGNYECVPAVDGVEIHERHDLVVLVDDAGRGAPQDVAEDAARHHPPRRMSTTRSISSTVL